MGKTETTILKSSALGKKENLVMIDIKRKVALIASISILASTLLSTTTYCKSASAIHDKKDTESPFSFSNEEKQYLAKVSAGAMLAASMAAGAGSLIYWYHYKKGAKALTAKKASNEQNKDGAKAPEINKAELPKTPKNQEDRFTEFLSAEKQKELIIANQKGELRERLKKAVEIIRKEYPDLNLNRDTVFITEKDWQHYINVRSEAGRLPQNFNKIKAKINEFGFYAAIPSFKFDF